MIFPECVARVPVSFGGVGVRPCSPKVVSVSATVRNRLRVRRGVCVSDLCPRSYIGVIAVILAFAEEVSSGVVPKSCQVDPSSPSYVGVCRGGVSVSDLRRRS